MVKVSVIVPVYNGQKHLRKCLDSICAQTLRDIEVIVVDDGSTDSTPQILEEYAARDSRFQILHQQNQYAGVARNNGMAKASGQYLMFWDADDFFEPKALELLYEQITGEEADICVCGGFQYDEASDLSIPTGNILDMSLVPSGLSVFNAKTNPDYILNFTRVEVWNKMFRRSFVEERKLQFQAVRNSNDVWFVVHALCMADRITVLDVPLVSYRINQKSSLTATGGELAENRIRIWMTIAEDLRRREIFPERSFVNKAAKTVLYLLQHISDFSVFCHVVKLLQEEALDQLGITDRKEEFYYQTEHCDLMAHLRKDKPEEFLMYLCNRNYLRQTDANGKKRLARSQNRTLREKLGDAREQIRELKKETAKERKKLEKKRKELENKQKELTKLQNSREYRLGTAMLKVPNKIKSSMDRRTVSPRKNVRKKKR